MSDRRNARLDLLSAPARIGLSHAARGFDQGDELKANVAKSGDTDDATSNVGNDLVAEEKASDEDVENTTTNEGEEEVGVSRNLGRDLEFQQSNSKSKNNHVDTDNDILESNREDVENTTKNRDTRHNQVNNAEDIGQFHGCE